MLTENFKQCKNTKSQKQKILPLFSISGVTIMSNLLLTYKLYKRFHFNKCMIVPLHCSTTRSFSHVWSSSPHILSKAADAHGDMPSCINQSLMNGHFGSSQVFSFFGVVGVTNRFRPMYNYFLTWIPRSAFAGLI
jgi:hypothetical protein